MKTSVVAQYCLALAFLVLVGALSACGVAGQPKPRRAAQDFTLHNVLAVQAGSCMVAHGTAQGVIANVDRIDMELAPIQGPEDCPGCPFNALEHETFTPADANLNMETGVFLITYCPVLKADSYRWRLVGRNVYPGLPYVVTAPQILVMSAPEK